LTLMALGVAAAAYLRHRMHAAVVTVAPVSARGAAVAPAIMVVPPSAPVVAAPSPFVVAAPSEPVVAAPSEPVVAAPAPPAVEAKPIAEARPVEEKPAPSRSHGRHAHAATSATR
jgi:hypothetical protein